MWLFFAILAVLAFASTDLLGKRNIDTGTFAAPQEMIISSCTLFFCVGLLLFAFGIGGQPPWVTLRDHPLILVNMLFFLMYWLLYLLSLRYIGLSIQSALSGANGILYFFGAILIHAFSGRLPAVHEILHPARLTPVLLVLGFTLLYPNVELLAGKRRGTVMGNEKKERHNTVVGLLILSLGIAFDAGDTLLTSCILDAKDVGVADYLTANYSAAILPVILLSLWVRMRKGKWFIPFRSGGWTAMCYPAGAVASSLLYVYASSLDAVRTGIMFTAEPIIPILGAKLILKEKYTWRQNLCIWIIAVSVTFFCAADYFL